MRVAHIVNSLTRASGISYFCANIAQHLAEQGVDVDLYVWWVGEDALIPEHERITVYETKDNGFHPVHRPDIVHIHALWEKMVHEGCVYARRNEIPYIISPHGMLTPWALQYRWWKKLAGMLLFQYQDLSRACQLHATARGEIADICRLYLRHEVAVVPLGTDLPSNSAEYVSTDLLGKSFHSPEKPDDADIRTVLFLSRVHPKKGLLNLFRAWAALKSVQAAETQGDASLGHYHWRLVIAGPNSDGHKQELLSLAQSLILSVDDLSECFCISDLSRLSDECDIVFVGPVYGDDKKALHSMADLFVLPTFSENFGVVVPDSLAYSVPVITTKGTPWEELNTEQCGWWIDIGVEPLVGALREAMNMTEEQRRKLGENGRRLVEKKYSWPVVAGEMRRAYGQMLSPKVK